MSFITIHLKQVLKFLLNKKCKETEVLARKLGMSDKKVSIYYFDCGFLQGVEIPLRVLIATKLLKISII